MRQVLLMREIDGRFKIIAPREDCWEDLRSPAHTKHLLVQMIRPRVYQIAVSHEDCNPNSGKIDIPPKFALSVLDEKIWLREEDRLGDFTRAKRLQNLVGQK